ncbi:peptidoglycan-binding protein [Clostridium gasigenes]|uniref:peptidoglycan-binding protein n=1 Tax=Clostridium gasigenes TaxID=94869 RepID=UPI001C0BF696|nr:peptidoglycan-binding protein [Clostridium gasigenes]MBU3108952.1 peptidoglycan-binding protein [Clostridium gasigenes]
MGKGYILVRLFKVMDALPKTRGSLKVTNAENGNIVYQKDDAFDISGRSEIIEVDTPEKSLSQQPYESGIIPYGRYNLDVLSDGFVEVIVEGVSVFEENTSIQNVELKEEDKISEFTSLPEVIVIPEQQLVLKEQRDKQIGTMKYPYVLDKVYIPEFIVVHLGYPSSGAENVTVGFVDYIKNVASSEIYPTWPEESLKANIYCQISFALNRIYTEWYRNKGYSFQITNSTAYDQYFIKGRNIYENISKIVDEIFSKYIITIGNKTPFFAQYCNGTTVKCDGLSQWGSVDLANAGVEALDIIKYYFGYDKDLLRAAFIEGIPESYPGAPLRLNDINENVKVIQKQLNRISQNFPAIPKIISVDGKFDKQTEDSVKTFQKVFNLTQDGIVGRATWYRISDIYVGVKRLADLNQEPEIDEENQQPEVEGQYPGYLLRYGSRGEKVKEMQSYLAVISSHYNIPTIKADGIFGNATKEAVIAFQRLFELTPDGLVGVRTWDKIYEVYKLLQKEVTQKYLNPEFDGKYPGYLLGYGSRGEKVREMQTYLSAVSQYYNIPNIKADGIFGMATRDVVIAFQRLFGLAQDGLVGSSTWEEIYGVYKGLGESNEKLKPIYSSGYPGYVLKENLVGEDVKWLQTYLQAISRFYKKIPRVEVDGVFNKGTKNAVIAFQKEFQLNDDGNIGVNDWNKLISVYDSLDSGKNINKSDILYSYPGFNLEIGDKDGYVTVLQQYINVIAKNNYRIDEIPVTGEFDNNTKIAVEKLQKEFGLKVTGIVDEITWDKISSTYEDLYTGKEIKEKRSKSKKSK